MEGLAEQKIRSVSKSLEAEGILKIRLHATEFLTILKMIENDFYNLPFGYSYGRSLENSPILRLIFPNLLRVGRGNSRAMDGPLTMLRSSGELMDRVGGA